MAARAKARKPKAAAPSLAELLGYKFRDASLLERALTHSSFAYEARLAGDESTDNEVMEFLGDAVLGAVAAAWLCKQHPEAGEGELTRMRAALVKQSALAAAAERLQVGEHLRLGRGELASGGREKAALLADALEAVVAAVYLDSGFAAAKRFVERAVLKPGVAQIHARDDAKSELQEWLQAQKLPSPKYSVLATSGPDHARRYTVQLTLAGRDGRGPVVTQATAGSQKEAQQKCARQALEQLQ